MGIFSGFQPDGSQTANFKETVEIHVAICVMISLSKLPYIDFMMFKLM